MQNTILYIEDEDVALNDGRDYTNAVLRDCRVSYSGGEAVFEGAIFIDCKFSFAAAPKYLLELQKAVFRGYYAQGQRSFTIDSNGDHYPQ